MNNGNSSDRLDRIENILDRLTVGLEETKAIATVSIIHECYTPGV